MADEDKDEFVFTLDGLDEDVKYVSGIRFPCHVCGLFVWMGKEASGRQSIVHKQPMCDRFRDSDPLEFLTEARKHYEKEKEEKEKLN